MKGAEILTLGTTVICLMGLPTYIGYKTGHLLAGILFAGFATISYVLYVAIKGK